MPSLSYLAVSDKLRCQGGATRYGVLHGEELESASDVQAVEDQESLRFQYQRLDETGDVRAFTAQLRAGRVITIMWSDGEFDEWRVSTLTTGRGERGLITVTCVPLWLDLVERADAAGKGWVSDTVGTAVRNFGYELTERTASSIWAGEIIPNAPSWVTAGTIDPTYVIPSLTVSRLTPGALALAVRDALREVNVPCEVRLRRNGTTDYKLDLVTQIGASANTPVFHPSTSLLTLTQKSDATLQATRVLERGANGPDGEPGVWGRARFRGAAPVGNTIALTDRNGGADPIEFAGQFVGMYLLRVKTGRTFLITDTAPTGVVTLSGVSTIAADEDFEFRVTEPLTNTRTTTTRYAVSALTATTLTLGGNPLTVANQFVDWYAKVWSLAAGGTVIATLRITASTAADVLTVASTTGVTTSHYVEFVQLDGKGEIPSFVDHPTYIQADPVGYGVKALEESSRAAGVVNLVNNSWFRTWTNGANPPDGFTIVDLGGVGARARNSAAAYTRYGGYSWGWSGGNWNPDVDGLYTAPIYLTNDNGFASFRVLVYYTAFTGAVTSRLALYAAPPDGVLVFGAPTPLFDIRVASLDYTLGGLTLVGTGMWVEIVLAGVPITPSNAPDGVILMWQPGSSSGYLDTMEAFAYASCPSEPIEYGDASVLLQSANGTLVNVASPPLFYQFRVLDRERAEPTEFSRLKLTLGANARAADIEYGIDATVRVLAIARNLLNSNDATLTLANRPTRATRVQSTAAESSRRVIAAVNAGAAPGSATGGTAFVALTGATVLTAGAEIATTTTAPPEIKLPTVTVDAGGNETAGASVTYVPPDTTTAPTKVVTVGRPPSRQKPLPPLD